MQVINKRLYKSSSCLERGTLYHLRNVLNRRNVSTTVKKNVNAWEDFLHLTTTAHVLEAAMQYMGMGSLKDMPSNDIVSHCVWMESDDIRKNKLEEVSLSIVEKFCNLSLTYAPEPDQTNGASTSANSPQEDVASSDSTSADSPREDVASSDSTSADSPREDVASSDSTSADSPQEDEASSDSTSADSPQEDEASSDSTSADSPREDEASSDSTSADSPQDDVASSDSTSADSPQEDEASSDSTSADSPQEDVASSDSTSADSPREDVASSDSTSADSPQDDEASNGATSADSPQDDEASNGATSANSPQDDEASTGATAYDYACEALSLGLLLMEFRDGIREGDGERVLRVWKYLFLIFKATGHHNYALEAFTLLEQYHFLLPPFLAEQLKWLRFINTHGKKGKNISMDLHMEHLNRLCKTAINGLGSNKAAKKAITRVGKTVGVLDGLLENFDRENSVMSTSDRHTTRSIKQDLDIALQQLHGCFDSTSTSAHKSFKKLTPNLITTIKEKELKAWMTDHIAQLVL